MKLIGSKPDERPGFPAIRMTAIAAMMTLATACTSQSRSYSVAQTDAPALQCPRGSTRTCEVIGGNKFAKRYGRCACWQQ